MKKLKYLLNFGAQYLIIGIRNGYMKPLNLSFRKPWEVLKSINGARGRSWTGTVFLPRDFKSLASTNFATRAYRMVCKIFPCLSATVVPRTTVYHNATDTSLIYGGCGCNHTESCRSLPHPTSGEDCPIWRRILRCTGRPGKDGISFFWLARKKWDYLFKSRVAFGSKH